MYRFASSLLIVVLTIACPASARSAATGGLAPCGAGNPYYADVDLHIDRSGAGTILLGFTAYPSFETEWGVRVLENTNRGSSLLVVEFKHSVWDSAFQEKPKGTFRRNPAKADHKHATAEIPVSPELLQRLRRLVDHEVGAASESNSDFGLDGTFYRFTAAGRSCATVWSPDEGTRAGRLVAIFKSLRALAHAPTAILRRIREERILKKLDDLLPPR